MKKKSSFGFGISGCGMIGQFHAEAIGHMKGGHLECVFDLFPASAKALGEKFNVKAYTKYSSFLKHQGLDVVTIGTPSGAHLDLALKAARAKKHIVCEKPLEITLERIDKMIAECKKNKVTLAGVHPRRFFGSVREFKKAVDGGRLGKITMADAYIKWFRTQEYYDKGGWRGSWKLDGGGALMNQSIHTIDQLYHLAGDVSSVCAYASLATHKNIEVEDIAVAILKFKNGAHGVIEGSTSCFSNEGHGAEVHLCGTDGSIFMKDDSFRVWDFKKKRSNDKSILKKFGEKIGKAGVGAADPKAISYVGHMHVFEDLVKAVNNGTRPYVDGAEARKSVEIILAIYKSALAGGKEVKLPLKRTPIRKKFK